MKTKLLFLILTVLFFRSIKAQEVWQDYGNSERYLSLANASGQDLLVSIDNYDFSSESPTIPLESVSAAAKRAFKFVKNEVETSGSPNVTFDINGSLASEALGATNISVSITVSFYIVADSDGSTGVDLEDLVDSGGNPLQFTIQMIDTDTGANQRGSIRPTTSSGESVDFSPGWQTLSFNVTVRPSDATNLDQYDRIQLLFDSTTEDPSTAGLKFWRDSANNFLNEKVEIYIGSITSNVELDATVLSTKNVYQERINFYPNPVENLLYINNNDIKSVNIYNLAGSLVKTIKSKQVDVSDFAKGLYILEAQLENGGKSIERFIKK